jgi:hypothetical protein
MLCLINKYEGPESDPFLGYNAPIGFIFRREKKKLSCQRDECLKLILNNGGRHFWWSKSPLSQGIHIWATFLLQHVSSQIQLNPADAASWQPLSSLAYPASLPALRSVCRSW